MRFDKLLTVIKGGAGSGNFGHSGRPGKIGGSAGGASAIIADLEIMDHTHDRAIILNVFNELGYTDKPTPTKNLDSEISNGAIELYRGVGSKEQVEQFKTGEYFLGRGAFGSGIYTSAGSQGARTYDKKGETTIRMALSKDAKVADYDELQRERNKVLRDFPRTNDLARGDDGLAAALLGYDAIRISDSSTVLVLNRSKLLI